MFIKICSGNLTIKALWWKIQIIYDIFDGLNDIGCMIFSSLGDSNSQKDDKEKKMK